MKPSLDFDDGMMDMYDNGELTTLFYDEDKNVMFDEGGFVIHNIFSIISPNSLFLFKKGGECMMVRGVSGQLVDLVWPEHDET